ncbi:unnamed protein product [Brassica oleracea var. botrytis]
MSPELHWCGFYVGSSHEPEVTYEDGVEVNKPLYNSCSRKHIVF